MENLRDSWKISRKTNSSGLVKDTRRVNVGNREE